MRSQAKRSSAESKDEPATLRAAIYARVSTGKQAEGDLSLPDQQRQAAAYCKARGWEVVMEFVDAGVSGTTDNRPEFQRLLDMATNGTSPFDVVVVHSLSRFMRDLVMQELHLRRLAGAGVRLIAITQDVGDDAAGVMARQMFGMYNEYLSNEIRKHVKRGMNENARQGFWNGAAPPYGYTTVTVEQRGARLKKKLAIDPVEAENVRLIFRLLMEGDGTTGPKGIKAAVSWLNANGYRTRGGARWGTGPLYGLISNTVYKGQAVFNRMDSKTRKLKPVSEHIIVPVDPIIDPAVFDALQAQLKSRNPRVMPPRVVTGPILLTGIATCASCGGGMTLRTGKSGRYRYYVCAAAAQKGKTACSGRSVPMDRLDNAVMSRVADQLLVPGRVADMLRGLTDRQTKRDADYADRLTALRGALADAEGRLGRLYQAIESGIADLSDDTLKDRIAAVKTERDIAQAGLDRAVSEMRPEARITEERIAAFVGMMRENVLTGDTPFRRAWLRAVIDEVEVDDQEIRIHGRKTVLERLVMAGGATPAGVPSFVRKWRAPPGEDDNYVYSIAL